MKKKTGWFIGVLFFIALGVSINAARTDIISYPFDSGSLRGTDAWRVDSDGNMSTYTDLISKTGDLSLGDALSRPSTTAGTYPNIQVPFYNGSGSTLVEGDVVVASGTFSSATQQMGSYVALLATTTVIGICQETVANGAVGRMAIAGYSLVRTTGPVTPGVVAVTSNTVTGSAGNATGTIVVGSGIGKFMTGGTENTQLLLIDVQ